MDNWVNDLCPEMCFFFFFKISSTEAQCCYLSKREVEYHRINENVPDTLISYIAGAEKKNGSSKSYIDIYLSISVFIHQSCE